MGIFKNIEERKKIIKKIFAMLTVLLLIITPQIISAKKYTVRTHYRRCRNGRVVRVSRYTRIRRER